MKKMLCVGTLVTDWAMISVVDVVSETEKTLVVVQRDGSHATRRKKQDRRKYFELSEVNDAVEYATEYTNKAIEDLTQRRVNALHKLSELLSFTVEDEE